MCLVVKEETPIKIAEKDIICYKTVEKSDKEYESSIQKFIYKPYTTYSDNSLEKKIIIQSCIYADNIAYHKYSRGVEDNPSLYRVVEKGFHSYKSINRIPNHYPIAQRTIKCTIPKGAEYIEDETELIVSNKIKIHRIINSFWHINE